MLTRRVTILAKIETTYGTDAVPVAGDAILINNMTIKPAAKFLERSALRASLSPQAPVVGEKYTELTFQAELKGSGVATTPPEVGVLLRACAMAQTIGGTSVSYLPESDPTGFESITIYVYMDGLLHKITGARGTWSLNMVAGEYGVFSFTFQGLYNAPTDTAIVTGTYDATVPPVVRSAAFAIGAYSPVATKLEVALNNAFAQRRSINAAEAITEIMITARNTGGSFDPEAVLEATNPFWGDWRQGTSKALTATIGSSAGNRCVVTAPSIIAKELSHGDRDGILTYEEAFTCAETATTNDELKLEYT